MTYTEKYVSALAAGGGDGSVGSPWTFTEAVTGVTNGCRVNVKADGPYTITGGSAAYSWIPNTRCGTPAQPVMWRGYGSTIGDGVKAKLVNGGSVVSLTVQGDMNSRHNLVIRDFDIEFNGGNSSGVVQASDGAVFINCKISQTDVGTNALQYCVGGVRSVFISCEFVNANTAAVSAACIASNSHLFYGCVFRCAKHLFSSLGSANAMPFQRNVCVCTTSGNEARLSVINTEPGGDKDRPTLFANNVFDGFNGGLVFKGDNTPSGIWLNNIFANATNGVVLTNDLTDNTDHALLFLGNRYYNVTNVFSAYLDNLNSHIEPWLGFTEITSDPFEDAANGDYRITGGSGLVDTALPLADSAGTLFGVDVGAYEVGPIEDYPAETDVRNGVDYKNGLMTGDCHVPVAADTRAGTAVDHTVGTMIEHVPRDITFEDQTT